MSLGPGRYDDALTKAREATGAEAAILIVINGDHGFGFSAHVPAEILPKLPTFLRAVALEMEEDLAHDYAHLKRKTPK